jgi:tRNA(Ile)-lysidine synthase
VDYDKIKGVMFLCGRQPGQKMQLPGREFSSPLKKLVQAKVPPHRRKTVHLLKDDTGVVYAEYVGAAGSVSVDKTTRRFLRLEVEEKRK